MKEQHIEESQIHLWHADQVDYDLPSLAEECLSWLTESELRRYHRYCFDEHRKQLLLGRILMRVALSHYDSAIAPSAWKFSHNDYGKPALSEGQDRSRLHFNLSHSAQRAVLAVSRHKDIGVDIERSTKPRRVEAIAQRYFSPSEAAALLALPASQQQERFYDLWTLKEAYIKACGMGLAIPLQHFSYGFLGSGEIQIEFDMRRNDVEAAWQFWQIAAEPGYKLSLAVKSGVGERAQKVERIVSRQLERLDRFSERETKIVRCK